MGDVNLNYLNLNTTGIRQDFLSDLNPAALNDVNDILSGLFADIGKLFDALGGGQSQNQPGIMPGGCCMPPQPEDGAHPSGSLTTDGGVITTPGGYKIESTGQFEWKITGPDGKETKVWGDPHVAEGDGGKWDFKRNSTFVLGDGTKVNVNTAPYGDKGMTVTSGLEIISGNDRVTVDGIDKGKGVVGDITHDGFAHANSFAGDVFVMGSETDDWSFQGREITGSENGGDSFKLGDKLAAGNTKPAANGFEDFMKMIQQFISDLTGNWDNAWKPNALGSNPYYDGLTSNKQSSSSASQQSSSASQQSDSKSRRTDAKYDRQQHRHQIRDAFRMLGQMFSLMSRLSGLSEQMNASRNRTNYA